MGPDTETRRAPKRCVAETTRPAVPLRRSRKLGSTSTLRSAALRRHLDGPTKPRAGPGRACVGCGARPRPRPVRSRPAASRLPERDKEQKRLEALRPPWAPHHRHPNRPRAATPGASQPSRAWPFPGPDKGGAGGKGRAGQGRAGPLGEGPSGAHPLEPRAPLRLQPGAAAHDSARPGAPQVGSRPSPLTERRVAPAEPPPPPPPPGLGPSRRPPPHGRRVAIAFLLPPSFSSFAAAASSSPQPGKPQPEPEPEPEPLPPAVPRRAVPRPLPLPPPGPERTAGRRLRSARRVGAGGARERDEGRGPRGLPGPARSLASSDPGSGGSPRLQPGRAQLRDTPYLARPGPARPGLPQGGGAVQTLGVPQAALAASRQGRALRRPRSLAAPAPLETFEVQDFTCGIRETLMGHFLLTPGGPAGTCVPRTFLRPVPPPPLFCNCSGDT
ncbi:translation initiation factor IF-2-like [Suncus etruscus]|uniref:translation initiation factor IF-2-like n=1 Tax=Suncus etruscus TaxID=109475 RepID=UPI00210F53CE|nr:translation initiation factor IF-2-like [Suncus etruscus]